jgi:Flp pilus assembly protein CpaB
MRAITIPLDPVSSVAGFLKPRDHVDVIGTFDAGENTSVTKIVLPDVLLLATGAQLLPNQTAAEVNPNMSNDNSAPAAPTGTVAAPVEIPNATVEVSPIDADKLIIAMAKGKLQLALRSADDQTIANVPEIRSTAVTGVMLGSNPAPEERSPIPISAPPIPTTNTVIPVATVLPTITVIKGSASTTVTVGQ